MAFVATALHRRGRAPRQSEAATDQLSFFLSPRGFGATVSSGEFLHSPGGIYKLLFACEKGMTSGTNTDLNIATSGAGVIHRAACAHDIGLVVFWMDAGFHLRNGARNLIAQSCARKV
jgi:hypothetical protein